MVEALRSESQSVAGETANKLDEQTAEDAAPRSITGLDAGEESIHTERLGNGSSGELELTDRRIIVRGSADSRLMFSSMDLHKLDSISVLRVPHGRRPLYWGIVGVAASIAVWQSLDGTGNLRLIVTAVVALASAALITAHLIQPPDVRLVFRSAQGHELHGDFRHDRLEDADRFAVLASSRLASIRDDVGNDVFEA